MIIYINSYLYISMYILDILNYFKRKKIHPAPSNNISNCAEFNWSSYPTTTYHWWPMKETTHGADDPYNNLYSKSGGLGKYDALFGTSSTDYQKKHYFRKYNSNKEDANWAGFCDLATTLSCLYTYPKYYVTVIHGSNIKVFTPRDIESLMIVSCNNGLQKSKSIFYGERNDGYEHDDPQEPYPTELLNILKKVCNDNVPFAMDIDSECAVWNYSFDRVKIITLYTKPLLLNITSANIPKTGKTEYIHFIITSKAYPKKKQNLWGWINYTNGNKTEGWLSTCHPDFVWKKYKKHTQWTGNSRINPEINTNIVYKIYKRSLQKNNDILLISY